jgi:hypothetical protein
MSRVDPSLHRDILKKHPLNSYQAYSRKVPAADAGVRTAANKGS